MSTLKPQIVPREVQMSRARKALMRRRRKAGLVQADKPWDWLSASELQKLVVQAYRVTAYGFAQGLQDGQDGELTRQGLREGFACELAQTITDFVMAHATVKGGCWPKTPETPLHHDYAQIVANHLAALPLAWRPQYPVFKPKTAPSVKEQAVRGVGVQVLHPDVAPQARGGIPAGIPGESFAGRADAPVNIDGLTPPSARKSYPAGLHQYPMNDQKDNPPS